MKYQVYLLFIISALLTMAWPFALLLSVFIFDSPTRGVLDLFGRIVLALLLISYPWGFIMAAIRFINRRKNNTFFSNFTMTLLIAPISQLLAFFVFAFILNSLRK